MRFVKIYDFELMKVGQTQNSLKISESQIEESIVHHAFDNAPIVFNQDETFKDYRNDEYVEKFNREKVIGVVLPNTVNFNGFNVTANVMLLEEFSERTHFDNWCIKLNDDKIDFEYDSCELYSTKEN